MIRTVELLDLGPSSVVAVVGCGGKTSLIEKLAGGLRGSSVLVSPTTQMYPMKALSGGAAKAGAAQAADFLAGAAQAADFLAGGFQAGAAQAGSLNPETGKLEALPDEALAELVQQYDITLLEADGSRGLPCKGWRTGEPVVPRYCTHTVGVVTLNALGKAATRGLVHRLPEFLALTGLREGEAITPDALEKMACAPQGMFKNSVGRRYLLANQVEDGKSALAADEFLSAIREKYPGRFALLAYGSVQRDDWRKVGG